MRRTDETDLHIAAVSLLEHVLPKGAIVHHSHNEGKRSKRDAGLAKAMGQRPGFADLIILYRNTVYFIEFKSKTGTQTVVQMYFEMDIRATDFKHYEIVRSLEELVAVLDGWGILARGVGNAGPVRAGAEKGRQTPIIRT